MNVSTLVSECLRPAQTPGASATQTSRPAGKKTVATRGWSDQFSDRTELEQQLTEALDFNWKIISGVPAGIAVFKHSGQCVLANEAAARMIQGSVPQILRQNFRQLESWRNSGLLAAAEKTLATQTPQAGEFHLVSSFGKEVWLVAHCSCFMRNDELHLLLALNDITEAKRTEKSLRMFQFATDRAAEGVFWLNRDARFHYVNDQACLSLGYTREELMQLSLFDIDPLFSREQWEASWRQFERKELAVRRLESVHQRKDGSRFPVEVTAKHFSVDDNDLHVTFVRDITERKLAEEKNRLQAILLDEATDAIWGLDLNERISYWNKGAERLYGWSAAEAIGKNPVDLLQRGIMTPQLHACINAVKKQGSWAGEMEEFTKDGKNVIVQGRCNALHDDQGRLQSVLVLNTDITEKKKMETQFLRSQRMESLGTLAGGIAHDLNNILAPLLIAVQLLQEKVTDDDGQKLLQTLETNVERGARLVRQVLTFGRGARGERAPVPLDQVIREIEQIIRGTFPKYVEFAASSAAGLWNVTGDATQLHQVLLNLCVNARDAMPNGGKLSLHIENVVLDETSASLNLDARPGSYVMIQITDTGIGIPKPVQDRMFEPFFTTKAPGKGTGLGLSTCLGIVKGHGGFIHCYSEPGNGSAFKVYLPASAPVTAPASPAPDQGEPSRGQNELVLVVDDETALREIAQSILEKFGYRVVAATNGAEAVELYRQRQNEIAAVVMDLAMPVMDGRTAIAALKAINPRVKIIGTSGLNTHSTRTGGAKLDAQDFMSKPYSARTLLHTLQKTLATSP